ncbi:MAG: hypothetical protein K0Q91_1063 [Fibrobacteria bacterium]|jgi:hypothetical protein|nr:hypothetical protein [Fibrobacteria bacterium]
MRVTVLFTAVLVACAGSVLAADDVSFRLHGQGWTDRGRIMKSSDRVLGDGLTVYSVNGSPMQSLGGQFTVDADLGEKWRASFGLGVFQITQSYGSVGEATNYTEWFNTSMWRAYVPQANLTYAPGGLDNPWLTITAGTFTYNYNPDVKNLGLYLLRGPVYPGVLMSGFREFETDTTIGTQTGLKVHNAFGNFSQDLLFVNERVLPPTFDWSLAYVAKYRLFDALDVGAGVNFYRLVPHSNALETPGRLGGGTASPGSYEVTAPGDTVFYTHQGTKLMAMFSFDPKRFISLGKASAQDWKLYGEAAIIGVKDYGSYYDKIGERIPVVLGFNIPTFGLLDVLSIEGEWYGSPYRNDLANLGYPRSIVAPWQDPGFGTPSPVPVSPGSYADSTADNVKWSVFAQKTVARHIQFTVQIANDHYRPNQLGTAFVNAVGGTQAVLTAKKDWYMMGRVGFSF